MESVSNFSNKYKMLIFLKVNLSIHCSYQSKRWDGAHPPTCRLLASLYCTGPLFPNNFSKVCWDAVDCDAFTDTLWRSVWRLQQLSQMSLSSTNVAVVQCLLQVLFFPFLFHVVGIVYTEEPIDFPLPFWCLDSCMETRRSSCWFIRSNNKHRL